ncbi:MAG: hypothetical protein M9894_30770 [Planctomycetes bacterium]|nr:hypothetical protein [Planctomycetota bacterium]
MRVLFMHGLESSPQGDKARYLAARFEAHTEAMDTGDFLACLEQQARAIASFRPDVVVGSSFGGALAVVLLVRGAWAGPTLLLAQASARFDPNLRLPDAVPALLVHGTRDDVIDIEGSRRLARTGTPGLVRLVEVDDGHRLGTLLEGERLADLVREVAALRQ